MTLGSPRIHRLRLIGITWKHALLAMAAIHTLCGADIATDYGSITSGAQAQAIASPGTSGTVGIFGANSFPVLLGTTAPAQAAVAAGRHADAADGRAVAFSHTGFFDTTAGPRSTLFTNSILWASKQAAPAGTKVAIANNAVSSSFISGLGYSTTPVGTNLTTANLDGVHVLVLSAHTNFTPTAVANIKTFAAAGGGIVITATPWALNTSNYGAANSILDPFGLCYSLGYSDDSSWTAPAAAYPAIQSALPAADALIADKEGTSVMTAANRSIAANAVFQITDIRIDIPALATKLALLSDSSHYGMIAPTAAAPINTTSKPVEKMLASYQSKTFDQLTPEQLFVHPAAADFPGLPTAGAPTVSKTMSINGNTPTDFYMNHGERPVRIETGLYAPPGAAVTITIPGDKTAQGLQAHISPNGSQDTTFNISNWTFFPKLWRRVDLTQPITETGHVFGGLVTLLVPPGKSLGNFNVTISGAIEAPVFVLGQNTDAQWNATLKNNPAPYGYIQNSKLTIYLPKARLAEMSNAELVTAFWKQVMDTADEYYGYTNFRKRGEAIATARYVAAGAAYASYPIEAGWGTNNDSMLNGARLNGSWGDYHELGHNYQDIFDGAFVIANHAEVDVNLFPGMIYTMIHDRTAWDGAHSTYDASTRQNGRNQYLALSSAEQTWQKAHDVSPVVYDFYFNLSEAFGWQAYKTALSRLMRYLQSPSSATDAALHALSSSDPNFKRNRFYLLFCDATGRNLDAYFQRYGLGKVGAGYEITQSVKDAIAAKGYPSWTDNTPVDSLSTPANLHVSEDASPGTEIYQFVATDAEEPGTIWDYSITAGNTNGAFSIDKRTGKLRVQKADAESLGSYNLTVQVQDNGVPRFSSTKTFTVTVDNVIEPPLVSGRLYTATSAMGQDASLGTMPVALESGRTLASLEIVSGNDGHFSVQTASRTITVVNPSTLANPGVIVLTIKATDSAGGIGYGTATILCNRSTGIYQERWAGSAMTGTPGNTSTFTTFTSTQNAADTYIRRVSGWLVPAVTGSYTFWIASDDGSSLSLSMDEQEASKQLIASVGGYTAFQGWDETSSQKSASVFLQAGKAYYIEAIQQEGTGGDHVAVAWQGPGISRQVIPTTALVPRNATNVFPSGTPGATITLTSPAEGSFFFAPGTFPLAAEVSENFLTIFKVQFYDGATLVGEDTSAPYALDWVNPAPGPHALTAQLVHSTGTIVSNPVLVTVAAAGPPIITLDSPTVAEVDIPTGVGLALSATVRDDTPATLTTGWSKVSGPGTVQFDTTASATTGATFSANGTYVLRLTANDGSNTSTQEITVKVGPSAPVWNPSAVAYGTVTNPASSYDAGSGSYTLTGASAGIDNSSSSDSFQTWGQSFAGDFDIQFKVAGSDISNSSNERLGAIVRSGSAASGPSAFVGFDTTPTRWAYWITRATAGANNARTIVNNSWTSTTSWVRLTRAGSTVTGYYGTDGIAWTQAGTLTLAGEVFAGMCWSTDSTSSGTATFTDFTLSGSVANSGALVNAGPDQSVTTPAASLAGSASDDAQPAIPGVLVTRWSKVSGPGSVSFANANSTATDAAFSASGNYELRLTADDGQVKTFDDLAITMPSPFAQWQGAKFGASSGNPSVAGPEADPNHNRLANLLEYALGADPLANGGDASVRGEITSSHLTLRFSRDTTATDVTVTVQANDALDGPWTDLARSVAGAPFTSLVAGATVQESGTGQVVDVVVEDPHVIADPANPRRFMRLLVTQP